MIRTTIRIMTKTMITITTRTNMRVSIKLRTTDTKITIRITIKTTIKTNKLTKTQVSNSEHSKIK